MEKRAATGMRPEDFSGFCSKCPVDCQEDIVKLISKFCQGIVVEATSGSIPSSVAFRPGQRANHYGDLLNYWPSFSSSGGNDEGGSSRSNVLEVTTEIEAIPGDIRIRFGVLYKEIGNVKAGPLPVCGSPQDDGRQCEWGNPLTGRSDPGHALNGYRTDPTFGRAARRNPQPDPVEWGNRHTDHIDSISGMRVNKEEGVNDDVEGVPDFATMSVITTIEKIDIYLKQESFSIFPVCGDLQVKDSGSDYISVQAGKTGGTGNLPDGGYGVRPPTEESTWDGEGLFILISSDCPDPHPARSSEHPHMVGRSTEPTYQSRVYPYPLLKNPDHSDEREFDNVEQKKYLGMSRLTYAINAGSVYKTTISGLTDNEFVEGGDEVYYTSIDPRATTVPIIRKGYFGDTVYQKPLDIKPSASEIARHNLCDPETAGGSYGNYGQWIPNPSTPGYLLEVQRKKYIGQSEGYIPRDDGPGDMSTDGGSYDPESLIVGRGDAEAYCSWRPGDLAPFNAKQKEYIFDNLEDAINAQGELMKSSRQRIENSLTQEFAQHQAALKGLIGPVGCNKSKILAFGRAIASSGGEDDDFVMAGTQYIKSDSLSWPPLTEAFDINGSMLHNRSETEGFDLSNKMLVIGSTQINMPQPRPGLVGITFYKAELSYRDFAEKAEMKESYDLDFEEIYSRSFGFSAGATIPDGYGTGGYMKKANLDTPEKALLAWSRVGVGDETPGVVNGMPKKADLVRAGYYYRFFLENYYYDVTQEKNDFSGPEIDLYGDSRPDIAGVGFAESGDDSKCPAPDRLNGGDQTACNPPNIPPRYKPPKYGRGWTGPRDQLSSRIFTGGKAEVWSVGNMSDPIPQNTSYWPPRFDPGQRVHGDGTVDFDTFSHAIIEFDTYTPDPNNPDVDECVPDPYGYVYCPDGRPGNWKHTRNGTTTYAFGGGMRCIAEMTGEGPPDPDKYDYYVYRHKVQIVEGPKWSYKDGYRGKEKDKRIDSGPFSFKVCGHDKGYTEKWPARDLSNIIESTRRKYSSGSGWEDVPWKKRVGCIKCMGYKLIWQKPLYGPYIGQFQDLCGCTTTTCMDTIPGQSGEGGDFFSGFTGGKQYRFAGLHSPYQQGFMWYTAFVDDRGTEKFGADGKPSSQFVVASFCCCPPLYRMNWGNMRNEYMGCDPDRWPDPYDSQTDLSLLGCKIIKIEKPTSASGSVDLGELSVKISLK
jgi:hypothetical protein